MKEFSIKSILLLFILFTFNFSLLTFPAYAQGQDIGKSRISPASPLNFLKSIREILEIRFAGSDYAKVLYEVGFADRRIREVNSLVKTPGEDLIEPTLEKYWIHLQKFQEKANLKDKDLLEKISKAVIAHVDVLQNIYPRISNHRARRSIRNTLNRLMEREGQFIGQLKLFEQSSIQKVSSSKFSICNFLSKEASTSGLNEVEKEVLASRAETCFKTAI